MGLGSVQEFMAGLALTVMCSAGTAACALSGFERQPLWSGEVSDWGPSNQVADVQFGASNLSVDSSGLRVRYPRGSYDPAAVRTAGAPLGGAQFRTPFERMAVVAGREIGIRYRMTLDDTFQFVRGGKLPGLFGGRANTGGNVPDGTDGFSLRFVWQALGVAALSAYLPTSGKWGTVFGLGRWRFTPGRTIDMALFVRLNTPGLADGIVAAWADDVLVAYAPAVVFRSTTALGLDGFYFSTFFGGSTPDWATPVDTGITFGRMDLFRIDAGVLGRCAAGQPELQTRREID